MFFLLLDPHHHINIAVVHQCWAKKPCQGLSEEVCSCQKENMDNLFAVVRLFFFCSVEINQQQTLASLSIPLLKKKGSQTLTGEEGFQISRANAHISARCSPQTQNSHPGE